MEIDLSLSRRLVCRHHLRVEVCPVGRGRGYVGDGRFSCESMRPFRLSITWCTVRPYVEEQVSWPVEGFQPVDIRRLIATEVAEEVCGLSSTFVETPTAVRAKRREAPAPQAYRDPAFRHRATYVIFMKQLESRGLLRFGTPSRERITGFFVEKKGNRLRLIFDCRRTNQ